MRDLQFKLNKTISWGI